MLSERAVLQVDAQVGKNAMRLNATCATEA
jgi:hypothetical protein